MGPIVFAGSGWARLRSGVSANLSRVDQLGMVLLTNVNDESLLLQMTNGLARHGTVDLQALAHHRWRDQLCLWDFLHHLVVGGLVKLNHICKFLLDLALRPLFLLRLATSLGSFHLRFLRLLNDLVRAHGVLAASKLDKGLKRMTTDGANAAWSQNLCEPC